MDRLTLTQVKFHNSKAIQLKHEWETRKTAGEKRIYKMEQELKMELDRIMVQIKMHTDKSDELSS